MIEGIINSCIADNFFCSSEPLIFMICYPFIFSLSPKETPHPIFCMNSLGAAL